MMSSTIQVAAAALGLAIRERFGEVARGSRRAPAQPAGRTGEVPSWPQAQ
jgi:hypothetical protein